VLAAAIGASTDPTGEPKTNSEETKDTVAAVVNRALVDRRLNDVDGLLLRLSGCRSFVHYLLLNGLGIGRLLVQRSGRHVLRLLCLVVGHGV
jgi:hypothetical protein